MRRDDSSNVFLSLGPADDDDFGGMFEDSAPRSGSGGVASGISAAQAPTHAPPPGPATLRDPGPSIESELLRLCEEVGAPTVPSEAISRPALAPDTIPAPPNSEVREEESVLSSTSKLAREPIYDTIPAPPPSPKKEPSPSAPVLPPTTLPSARIPKFS